MPQRTAHQWSISQTWRMNVRTGITGLVTVPPALSACLMAPGPHLVVVAPVRHSGMETQRFDLWFHNTWSNAVKYFIFLGADSIFSYLAINATQIAINLILLYLYPFVTVLPGIIFSIYHLMSRVWEQSRPIGNSFTHVKSPLIGRDHRHATWVNRFKQNLE